jgi:hypothetical protein
MDLGTPTVETTMAPSVVPTVMPTTVSPKVTTAAGKTPKVVASAAAPTVMWNVFDLSAIHDNDETRTRRIKLLNEPKLHGKLGVKSAVSKMLEGLDKL